MQETFRCTAALFDMDGVLIDSLDFNERHLREWCDMHRIDAAPVIALSRGRTDVELFRMVAPHLDAQAEARLIEAKEMKDPVVALPGARELLQQLPTSRWAVVTSAARQVAVSRLITAGLLPPPLLITAGDVAKGKPAPDGYLLAASRLGAEPRDCIVFEDAPAGVAAAHEGGMRVVGVEGEMAPYLEAEWRIRSLSDVSLTDVAQHLNFAIVSRPNGPRR